MEKPKHRIVIFLSDKTYNKVNEQSKEIGLSRSSYANMLITKNI